MAKDNYQSLCTKSPFSNMKNPIWGEGGLMDLLKRFDRGLPKAGEKKMSRTKTTLKNKI